MRRVTLSRQEAYDYFAYILFCNVNVDSLLKLVIERLLQVLRNGKKEWLFLINDIENNLSVQYNKMYMTIITVTCLIGFIFSKMQFIRY